MSVFVIGDAVEMHDFGRRLGARLQAGDLVVLAGPLGAGKTTLTQGIAAGMQVRGRVTSPTFVIARLHPSLIGGADLVHVDAYRLGGTVEVEDLDLDASVEDSVTVVEWGEGLVEGLQDELLVVSIEPERTERAQRSDDGADVGDSEGEAAAGPRVVSLRASGVLWQVRIGELLEGLATTQ
jgi:tRNA threonylcarbamoyladenosine biosynthesis protein TsaE